MTQAQSAPVRFREPLSLPLRTIAEARRVLLTTAVVEVMTTDGSYLGRVVSCDDAMVVLRVSPDIDAEILVAEITRIDRVTHFGAEGALIGGGIGAIPLAILSWTFGAWARSGTDYYWFLFAALCLPVVGGLGAIGGIIGLAMKRRQPVFLPVLAPDKPE